MNKVEFIGLKSPEDLFGFIENIYSNYYHEPTETQLVTLIFTLNHLRDWISGGKGWNEIKGLSEHARNPGEIFFDEIYKLREFRDFINPLCNGIKHFKIEEKSTELNLGLRTGLGRCGDSLSQKYFTINGEDSRIIFEKVLQRYRDFFASRTH